MSNMGGEEAGFFYGGELNEMPFAFRQHNRTDIHRFRRQSKSQCEGNKNIL